MYIIQLIGIIHVVRITISIITMYTYTIVGIIIYSGTLLYMTPLGPANLIEYTRGPLLMRGN